jgi:ferredoxin
MAFVVTEPCKGCKYTDCVVVCPMECFYEGDEMLYIDPVDCIDCGACEPECPVNAIYAEADVPPKWESYIAINAERVKQCPPIREKKEPLVS